MYLITLVWENVFFNCKLIPDVISTFLTLCLVTVNCIPKTKHHRNYEGHVTWPDPDNDPLIYIANPIEAEVPGHWIPLSVLKHIVEKKETTPMYQHTNYVLKPEVIEISHEINSLEKTELITKTTMEPKILKPSTSNSSGYDVEVNTEDSNKSEDNKEDSQDKPEKKNENGDDNNETQTPNDAGVTTDDDKTTDADGDDDNTTDAVSDDVKTTGADGDDDNTTDAGDGDSNEQETTTADYDGENDTKNTDEQVDTTEAEPTTDAETAATEKPNRPKKKPKRPTDEHDNVARSLITRVLPHE